MEGWSEKGMESAVRGGRVSLGIARNGRANDNKQNIDVTGGGCQQTLAGFYSLPKEWNGASWRFMHVFVFYVRVCVGNYESICVWVWVNMTTVWLGVVLLAARPTRRMCAFRLCGVSFVYLCLFAHLRCICWFWGRSILLMAFCPTQPDSWSFNIADEADGGHPAMALTAALTFTHLTALICRQTERKLNAIAV